MRVRPRSSERGATAILVGLMAVVLFGIAAVSFDIGNAWARKRDVQTQVDLAALAGASSLPDEAASRQKVLDYLGDPSQQGVTTNEVWGQDFQAWDLSDADLTNGDVSFPHPYKIRVVAPQAKVDFGFAAVLNPGYQNVKVSAVAEVGVKSPGVALPMYVSGGCDWGSQTIIDAANGQTNPDVPTLTPASPVTGNPNNANLTGADPAQADVNEAPAPAVTISGQQLSGVTKVGFTTSSGAHFEHVLPAANTSNSSVSVSAVPPDVLAAEDLWYIRVWKNDAWSDNQDAVPFTVGSPTLSCAGSTEGNFGTLRVPRNDVPAGSELAMNIAAGVQVSLTAFPSPAPDDCSGHSLAVEATDTPNDGTNCLQTDPGIAANAVTEGLVSGIGAQPGLLVKDTTPGCDPTGGDGELYLENVEGQNDFWVNNDILSCFFTDNTVSVDEVSTVTYTANSGNPVIAPEIFESPRFFWLPVVSYDASNGTSHRYPIIEFRPAFLTDELGHSTQSSPAMGSATNGLTVTQHGITEVQVLLLHPDAFPETATSNGPVMDYLGAGTKVLRLMK